MVFVLTTVGGAQEQRRSTPTSTRKRRRACRDHDMFIDSTNNQGKDKFQMDRHNQSGLQEQRELGTLQEDDLDSFNRQQLHR